MRLTLRIRPVHLALFALLLLSSLPPALGAGTAQAASTALTATAATATAPPGASATADPLSPTATATTTVQRTPTLPVTASPTASASAPALPSPPASLSATATATGLTATATGGAAVLATRATPPAALTPTAAATPPDLASAVPLSASAMATPVTPTASASAAPPHAPHGPQRPKGVPPAHMRSASGAGFAVADLAPSCPAGWSCADIGSVTPAGGQSLSNGTWSVSGGGLDIWNTADQFHFVWQGVSGDSAVSAHVTSQTNTGLSAKAGVMIRGGTDAGAPFYDAVADTYSGKGVQIQYRASEGATAVDLVNLNQYLPIYLKVTRAGDTFTAYTSGDGVHWSAVSGSQVAIPAMPLATQDGLAVSSYNTSQTSTATFDTVAIRGCVGGWSCADIGGPPLAGGQSLSSGQWTVTGSGNDIGDPNGDAFHFVWQPLAGNGTLSARITSQTTPGPWTKAGLLLRASTDPLAPFYNLAVIGGTFQVNVRTPTGVSPCSAAPSTAITTTPATRALSPPPWRSTTPSRIRGARASSRR